MYTQTCIWLLADFLHWVCTPCRIKSELTFASHSTDIRVNDSQRAVMWFPACATSPYCFVRLAIIEVLTAVIEWYCTSLHHALYHHTAHHYIMRSIIILHTMYLLSQENLFAFAGEFLLSQENSLRSVLNCWTFELLQAPQLILFEITVQKQTRAVCACPQLPSLPRLCALPETSSRSDDPHSPIQEIRTTESSCLQSFLLKTLHQKVWLHGALTFGRYSLHTQHQVESSWHHTSLLSANMVIAKAGPQHSRCNPSDLLPSFAVQGLTLITSFIGLHIQNKQCHQQAGQQCSHRSRNFLRIHLIQWTSKLRSKHMENSNITRQQLAACLSQNTPKQNVSSVLTRNLLHIVFWSSVLTCIHAACDIMPCPHARV